MTAWLEHHKKVQECSLVMNWQQWVLDHPQAIRPPQIGIQSLKMSVKPSVRGVSFEDLIYRYGAVGFQDTMAKFIAQIKHPGTTGNTLQVHADDTLIPFHTVSAFHKIKFLSFTSPNSKKPEIVDTVHVHPEQQDSSGRTAL